MTVGIGPMILPKASADPCATSPNISSVGTPTISDNGNCGTFTGLKMSTSLTLTGTKPANVSVQYRWKFDQSTGTVPGGSWVTWSSFSGSSGTLVIEPVGPYARFSGENLLGTFYYRVEFRIVGTDGSTVCDGPDLSAQTTVTSVYDCFA